MFSLQSLHVSAQQRSGCQEVVASRGRDWSTFVCRPTQKRPFAPRLVLSWRTRAGFPHHPASVHQRLAGEKRTHPAELTGCVLTVRSPCNSYSSVAIHSTAYSSEIPANAVYIPKTNTASSKSRLTASHLVFFQLVQICWASCSTCKIVLPENLQSVWSGNWPEEYHIRLQIIKANK